MPADVHHADRELAATVLKPAGLSLILANPFIDIFKQIVMCAGLVNVESQEDSGVCARDGRRGRVVGRHVEVWGQSWRRGHGILCMVIRAGRSTVVLTCRKVRTQWTSIGGVGEIDAFHINFGDIRGPWGPIGQSFSKANPRQAGSQVKSKADGEAM